MQRIQALTFNVPPVTPENLFDALQGISDRLQEILCCTMEFIRRIGGNEFCGGMRRAVFTKNAALTDCVLTQHRRFAAGYS